MKLTKFLSVFTAVAVMLTVAVASTAFAATTPDNVGVNSGEQLSELTVTFKGNGGKTDSGETEIVLETKFAPNDKFVAIENPFKNGDHPFVEWSTESDGSGVIAKPGQNIFLDADLTENFTKNVVYYAVWTYGEVETKTNTYHSNFFYGGVEEEEIVTDEVDVDGYGNTIYNPFEFEGYAFVEWNTAADGSGDSYGEDDEYTGAVDSDMEFYAQWEVAPGYVYYTLTYDSNDDSFNTYEDQGVALSGEYASTKVRKNMFKNGNKFFNGWNTEPDGTGDSYAVGSTIELEDDDTVLYAQWSDNPTSGSTSHIALAAIGVAVAAVGVAFAFKKKD